MYYSSKKIIDLLKKWFFWIKKWFWKNVESLYLCGYLQLINICYVFISYKYICINYCEPLIAINTMQKRRLTANCKCWNGSIRFDSEIEQICSIYLYCLLSLLHLFYWIKECCLSTVFLYFFTWIADAIPKVILKKSK